MIVGRIDPVEYMLISQWRNEHARNINHPLCGCATVVIQKNYLSDYNKVVQAILQKGKVIYGKAK